MAEAGRYAIQVATVGKSPQPILDGLRCHRVDELVLLYNEGTSAEADEIQHAARQLGVKTRLVEIDAFDVTSTLMAVVHERRRMPSSEMVVNMTGGTNLMAAGALLGAHIAGVGAFYMRDGRVDNANLAQRLIKVNLPTIGLHDLSKDRQKMLAILAELGSKAKEGWVAGANRRIGTRMSGQGWSAPRVTPHVKFLAKHGLIEQRNNGRASETRLTKQGQVLAGLCAP